MAKVVGQIFTFSALSFLFGMPMALFAQDQCANALVKDTFNGNYSSVETLAAFRLRYGASSSSNNTSVGATIPIDGIPINFSYQSASSAAANYFDKSSLKWDTERLESVATQTLSQNAVEAYKACRDSLPSTGARILVYDATPTGATISVAWFSGPSAPTETGGSVTVDGGLLNSPFPTKWKTGQKFTRTIARSKLQDLRVVANIGGSSDDQLVSQLPPPPPIEPAGISIGSCVGQGGVLGVRLWGPTSEYCNGYREWGFYDARVMRLTQIGSCIGNGGVEGVRLYGPVGEDCGGIAVWGKYKDAVNISSGLSSCRGRGDILEGQNLWGPSGALCGGMSDPRWGTYEVGTKMR